MSKNILDQVNEYLDTFNKMSVLKQSVVVTTAIGAIIALLGNYKNIKNAVLNIFNKYKDSENVKEFVKDVTNIVKPVVDKVKTFFEPQENKEV